ncbi:DinB family protein [Pedobacter mucosus]|uniref:DinB family protein n=1 Tax=Pedobacter mucosus TaxID=2895286 RepID=UPI001EE474E7|nr:DinB family protein [Pedobacter mucosus]UKT62190.1 DinB family protein [Pedobacter mucosus]
MESEFVSSKMYGIVVLHEMQTDFLLKALEDIEEKDAQKRLDTKANHIAWITGSIVFGRFFLAQTLGVNITSQTGELFKENKGIIDDADYPDLEDFKSDWLKVSPLLKNALTKVSDETLDKVLEFPEMKMTLFDMIAFTTYREANCIGQIALWRRLLGYKGMNYM